MAKTKAQKFGGKPLYVYKVTPIRVHDGDTFFGTIDMNTRVNTIDRDLGFHLRVANKRLVWDWWIRLSGLNAIELANPGGAEAQVFLSGLIAGKTLSVHSHLIKVGELDLYERILGECFVLGADGVEVAPSVDQQMIDAGYAAAWDGRGPKPTPPWPRPAND